MELQERRASPSLDSRWPRKALTRCHGGVDALVGGIRSPHGDVSFYTGRTGN